MSRYICIISGKGGTGKTTSAISLAHLMGKKARTLLVDANLSTPNVNIHLGAPILKKTLMNVLKDEASLNQAIYIHGSGLRILPTVSSVHDLKRLKLEKLKKVLNDLRREADIIVIDSAASLNRESISAIEASNEILIITNPELSAVLDAQKAIQVAQELGKTILGVVVNKVRGEKHELKTKDIEKLLDLPVIGVIPYDKNIAKAQVLKHPVTHSHPKSKASKEYERIASLLLGKRYFESTNKKSKTMEDYVLREVGLK